MSVKSALNAQGLYPRKRWGQHFLTDTHILESIADAAEVTAADTILEIGPGLGHLTRVLARRAGRVVAVEIDAELAATLQSHFADTPNVTILHGDIMDRVPVEWLGFHGNRIAGTDPSSAPDAIRFKVVANLPYYITSAILRHTLEAVYKPRCMVVMVQRQVAQRMAARPPAMNLLAVGVQFFARVRVVRTIAAGAFYPRPKVDSAVVRLDVLDAPPLDAYTAAQFFAVVRAGFGERRKQLHNSLTHGLGREPTAVALALERAHIDPSRRAETLTLNEWRALYQELAH